MEVAAYPVYQAESGPNNQGLANAKDLFNGMDLRVREFSLAQQEKFGMFLATVVNVHKGLIGMEHYARDCLNAGEAKS